MANHRVIMREPKKLLRKKDVEFTIRIDGELMGTLMVSRGGTDSNFDFSTRNLAYKGRITDQGSGAGTDARHLDSS